MKLDSADWGKINAGLLRLYRELDAENHARVMLQVLNELVPADSLVVNHVTLPDKLTAEIYPENLITQQQVELVGKYTYQSPYGYYVATRDASWKMTTDFMPIEDFQKTELYRLALAPLGINYQIGGMLAMMDNTAHVITVHRTHQNFTERERDILNTLHPHLVTSFLNAFTVTRANRSVTELQTVLDVAPGAYGYFYADLSLAWFQTKARAWLLEFFPDAVKDAKNIPLIILTLLHQSREEGGTPKSFSQQSGSEFLAVFLSQTPFGGWILRLERKPKRYLPHFRPLPQLTPRENEVLRWMVQGKRNGEIATILTSSPRTVEKQVQSILGKLKVENRATAIIRAMELAATQNHSA